ncbi:MAG: T9SS type A sorting domain-containing protein [Bacteroidetes bacterium]|nr:T9SS type A sorting domain-containing protein [Bacteroidota bacterium]
MKKYKLIFLLLFISSIEISFAQVIRTSIVEHFTNTSCSICASNNSSYYGILTNYPDAVHISFHPSAPYASDFFNQQNQVENDARTNFYGVYGGTPRLVVNGLVINNTNLNSTLNAATSLFSNFSIELTQVQTSNTSFSVKCKVEKLSADTTIAALLFVGASEDTIYQTTNNGETVHYNVFRKAISAVQGNTIQLPLNISDTMVYNFSYTVLPAWNTNRMSTIALLQRPTKQLINAAKSVNSINLNNAIPSITEKVEAVYFYPNPTDNGRITNTLSVNKVRVLSLSGTLLFETAQLEKNQNLDLSALQSGFYLLEIQTNDKIAYQKLRIK